MRITPRAARHLAAIACLIGAACYGAVAQADDPPAAGGEPAAAPDAATQSALDEIQREAERKRAEREEMERLRREVEQGRVGVRRPAAGRRGSLTQAQIRAARSRQRRQAQAFWMGGMPRTGGPGLPGRFAIPRRPAPMPGQFQVFRAPNGGGFAASWFFPAR